MTSINDYIAGGVGGAAGLIVGHPFDTTKVQLQTRQTSSPYKNTWEALANINKQGMAKGFFRGLAFPLTSYGLVNSVFFGVYGNTLSYFKGMEDRTSTNGEIYVAGCVAGFVQLFVACPVEVVKVVLQSQIPKTGANGAPVSAQYFRGPVHCTRWLVRTQGPVSLYRGLGMLALRDVPTFGVYTLVYESLYVLLQSWLPWDTQQVASNLVAGGMAGVCCWTPIMPFDVVKSLLQADSARTQYSGVLDCVRKLYRARGLAGFYTGIQMVWFRAFIVNAVTFLFYKKSLDFLSEKRNT